MVTGRGGAEAIDSAERHSMKDFISYVAHATPNGTSQHPRDPNINGSSNETEKKVDEATSFHS